MPPTIRVLASAAESCEAMLEVLAWARRIDFAYAWMSTAGGELGPWQRLDDGKIRRGIVGLSFERTDPDVLVHFRRALPTKVRVVDDVSGAFTFHPKVLLASRGNRRRAIVGSSNFTRGGFARNTELNLLIEGSALDSVFHDLEQAIESYWEKAERLTLKRLKAYREAHEARLRLERSLRSSREARDPDRGSARGASRPARAEHLNVPWNEYAVALWQRLRKWTNPRFTRPDEIAYLSQLAEVRKILGDRSFRKLDLPDARKVVGITDEFKWFGSTSSKWSFAGLLRDDQPAVARLVDRLDTKDDVDDEDIRWIFERAERHPNAFGISTLTRILCAKRPDWFISVNSANRPGMRKALGLAPETMNVDEYLELLRRIRALPWFDSKKRPKRDSVPHEREMWDARVALLDAFFYLGGP